MKIKFLLFSISLLLTSSLFPKAKSSSNIESIQIPDLLLFYNSFTISQDSPTKPYIISLPQRLDSIYNSHNLSTSTNPFGVDIKALPDSLHINCLNFCYPTNSQRITSRFGIRGARFHQGIDIGIKYGDTIRAPFDGSIRLTNYQRGGYGRYIIIHHDNGLETIFAHLSKTLVLSGQSVKAGDPIALGGNSGRSTGPHLHLEFRLLGNAFNPEKIINFSTSEINNINNDGYFLITLADTYSHLGDLEEMKRAAYHRVRSGETLSHIARRYGTTVSRLCALNRLKQTSILQIGQRIRYR